MSRHGRSQPPDGRPRVSPHEVVRRIEELRTSLHSNLARVRASETTLRRFVHWEMDDTGPLGFLTLDGEGRVLDCNSTLCTMLDRRRSDIEGLPLQDFVSASDQARFRDHLLRCRTQTSAGGYVTTQAHLERHAGDRFPALILSNCGVDVSGNTFSRTAVLDRTEEYEVVQALQRSECRLAAAVDASGAHVFEHPPAAGEHVFLSAIGAAAVECISADVTEPGPIATWLEQRCHPEDWSLLSTLHRGLEGRQRYELEIRVQHEDKDWRWLKIWAQSIGPPTSATIRGPARSFVGVVMDVTRDRRTRSELEKRARVLRRLTAELLDVEARERRQIATELHDDLAQTIVATSMKLAAMKSRAMEDDVREGLGDIEALVDRANKTARSLIFQISPPILEEAGMVAALEWLARDLGRQFELEIEINSKGDVPCIAMPIRYMLFRCVRELLINVAKHGGTHEARVDVRYSDEDSTLELVVTDDGSGFDPDALDSDAKPGYGLFSMEARLVSMGGRLELVSSPGGGTRVTLRLPVNREEATPAPDAGVENSRRGEPTVARSHRFRVLMVDDHDVVRLALAQMVTSQPDLEVVGEAGDGESGLALALELDPDVVLMDVAMPGIGGIEATRRLHAQRPHIHVIGLSMHDNVEIEKAMRRAGACAYLKKNESPADLLSAIRETVLSR